MSKNHYIIPIFVPHEGCPHSCVFCNQNSITGQSNAINAAYTRETIEKYLNTIPGENRVVEVSFFGGTFTAISMDKQRELLGVAKEYKESGRINHIRLSTRPDYIDSEILDNLKAYSVDIIELGIQSMDDEVLRLSGRGHSREDVKRASREIQEHGFILGHQFMLGLPGDSIEKDIRTAEEIIAMRPQICRIYPALVIKGTAMEYLYRQKKYEPYSLEKAVEGAKIVYCLLVANNINVIRIGLQPTDSIALDGDIVAGPFHPAFRELVEGSLYCDMVSEYASGKSGELGIFIHSKDMSKLYANKKQFFIDMKKQLNTINFIVKADDELDKGCILLKYDGIKYIMSIRDYIIKKAKEGKNDYS